MISILFGGALGGGYAGDDMEFDLSGKVGGYFDIVRKGSDRA